MDEPLPITECNRLKTLREYHILDTPPERQFDSIVGQAAFQCKVPISTFTLIDRDRQWFKSKVGLDVTETDRSCSICAHTVLINGPLIIQDASKDERFCLSPLVVGPPFIRFYAGIPVRAKTGEVLGSLCIVDNKPRNLTWPDFQLLQSLARQIEVQLIMRRSNTSTH